MYFAQFAPVVMLSVAICFYLYQSIAKTTHSYSSTRSSGRISYFMIVSTNVAFWSSNPQLQKFYTINCIVRCKILVYYLASYLLSGIPNKSALDFLFVVTELYILYIMLKAAPIMLVQCFMLSTSYYTVTM